MSFTPTNALPQIPAIQRAVDPVSGKISAEWLRWLNLLKQRTDFLSIDGIIDARTIIEGTITVDALPALSTMAGQINYSQLPSGPGTWIASPTISGDLTISANLLPSTTDASDLGSTSKAFRRGYISEINAVLFSKQTQQLYGGWLAVSKNAGTFALPVASADTAIDFGQAMTLNQFVLVRAIDSGGAITEEYIKVGTLIGGNYYNVTRNLSGAGAKNWPVSTPYQVRGVAGDGWIELNAFDTPRMSVFSQGSAYNNSSELIRIGHLAGMPNGSSGIGFYAGDATNYIRWDGTNFKVVGAGCLIDGFGITLGSGPSAYDAAGSLKFNREALFGVGPTNVYGLWTQSSGGAYQDLYLENRADRSAASGGAGASAKSSVYLKATGWSSAGNTATTPAQIRVRSEVGISEVNIDGLINANTGQIRFPAAPAASADPNTMDFFEEKDFTPTLVSSGGVGVPTYAAQTGYALRIGREVVFHGRITLSALSALPAGNLTIAGLPYTPSSTANSHGAVYVGYFGGLAVGKVFMSGYINLGAGTIAINALGAAATAMTQLTQGDLTGSFDIIFGGKYIV